MEKNEIGSESVEEQGADKPQVALSRRIWLELKDLLAGAAFPFVVLLVLNSTIIMFASTADLAISLLALIGGEIMLVLAFIAFGRANGSAAYAKTVLHGQKRSLGSKEEKVVCKTGEYALWKGAVIPLIVCIPYIIIQIIGLIYPNSACDFAFKYMFGWAYYPFARLGDSFQALGFIMIIVPVAAHLGGYVLGKLKQIKIQQAVAEQYEQKQKRRRK